MERWNWKERRHVVRFAAHNYATLDPGKEGCLMVFPFGASRPTRMVRASAVEQCARAVAAFNVDVLVVEAQYATHFKTAQSAVELAASMWFLLGFLSRDLSNRGQQLNVFEVFPASWQTAQKARYAPAAPKAKGFASALMMNVAQEDLGRTSDWRTATDEYRTGVAAAWGIAQWWQGLLC